jgi:DNA-binding CsgD family transcriptional regulator/PAS domain-containing protein
LVDRPVVLIVIFLSQQLHAAPDAVLAVDASGRVLDLNAVAERMFDQDRDVILTRPLGEFVAGLPAIPEIAEGRPNGADKAVGSSRFSPRVVLSGLRRGGERFPLDVFAARTGADPPLYTVWIRDQSRREELRDRAARRTELLPVTEPLARAVVWEWDRAGGRLSCSEELSRLLGRESDLPAPIPECLIEQSHPADRARLEEALGHAIYEGDLDTFDARIVRGDGELRYIRLTATRRESDKDGEGRVLGVVRDVTDERLAERRLDMRLAVSRVLAGWTTLADSAPALLETIATSLGCEVGTLWVPERDVLVPRLSWTSPRMAGSDFDRVTRGLRLPKGIGLVGWAWESREPVDLAALSPNRRYVRQEMAERAGLKTAVALPALAGDEVLGVIDVHTVDQVAITAQSLQTLRGIGYEIGHLLASRRGQLVRNPLTRRELQILRLAADGLSTPQIAGELVIERSTVKTHFDHIYAKLGKSDRAAAVAHALRRGLID